MTHLESGLRIPPGTERELEVINSNKSEGYDESIRRAAHALRTGGLVVFPTETVYGIAANAADSAAMQRLRNAKRNTQPRPYTVHLADPLDAAGYAPDAAAVARRLARKLWPGPLTLVCAVAQPENTPVGRKLDAALLPEIYHGHTVGLRCPDHPAAALLLREAGVPVVASSANRAGGPPPTDCAAALRDLAKDIDFAIDSGRTRYDRASTIVEVRADGWRVVREGVLDERTIRRAARSEVLMVCTGNSCRSPLAEYLFRAKLAERLGVAPVALEALGYAVRSAGTSAFGGGGISSGSLEELRRRGIEASGHRSQPVTVELLQQAERVYTMSVEHHDWVVGLLPSAAPRVAPLDPSGAVADPFGGGPDDYARCAAQIEHAVQARVEELLDEDRHW